MGSQLTGLDPFPWDLFPGVSAAGQAQFPFPRGAEGRTEQKHRRGWKLPLVPAVRVMQPGGNTCRETAGPGGMEGGTSG